MKKLMTLMLGMTFAITTVAIAFAQEAPKGDTTKKETSKKKSSKKKDTTKKEG